MGYQALLFCPDEKLSLVISQVFRELDFTVEPVHEPFAAVKKLMAQHYDAVVVDHDNEQNAALLFKSARNSNSNHSSLAIALVAGQAGIAKAYRIGANLVLTKPINVEQVKGTIRVARGLLRKTSEAGAVSPAGPANPATTANPAVVSAAALSQPDRRGAPRITFAAIPPEGSESGPSPSPDAWPTETPAAFPGAFAEATPAATLEDSSASAPAATMSTRTTFAAETQVPARQPVSSGAFNAPISNDAVDSGLTSKPSHSEPGIAPTVSVSSSARNATSASPAATGSATAPAPAVAAPSRGSNRSVESQPAGASQKYASSASSHDAHLDSSFSSAVANDGAPFGGVSKNSGGRSPNKKMLIAAVIVLALAALGYFVYGLFIKSTAGGAPRSVNLPQDSEHPSAGPNSESAPLPAAAASTANPAIASTSGSPAPDVPEAPSGQPLTVTGKIPVARIALNTSANSAAADGVSTDALETKKPSRPLLVKASGPGNKSQAEVSAPQLSAAVASANENNLSGVMSSASPSVPKLSTATLKISQGVSEALLIKRIEPRYPRAALQAHSQGAVQIEATISQEGFVTHPKILRGDPILARAALDAVSQWRYKPYYLDGAPVEIQTQITVNFRPN
jgi:TonB family protein